MTAVIENRKESKAFFVSWMKNTQFTDFRDQVKVLIKLGHFPDYDGSAAMLRDIESSITSPNDQSFKDAVASYQRFSSVTSEWRDRGSKRLPLQIDADFGPKTARSVRERFCPEPDILFAGSEDSKWSFTDLTFLSRLGSTLRLGGKDAADLCVQAGRLWCDVTPLTLRPWRSSDGNNGPNVYADSKNIDGPNGTLAYMYLPTNNAPRTEKNQMVIDTSEDWTAWDWMFFILTIAHEWGHAFGLGHIPNQGNNRALMNPYIQQLSGLQPLDIAAIQKLYGKKPGGPGPTPDPTDPPTDDKLIRQLSELRIPQSDGTDFVIRHTIEKP